MRDRTVKKERPLWSKVLAGGGHAMGVATLSLVALWWQMREVSPELLVWAESRGYSFGEQNAAELALHVALCALAWFTGAFLVHHGRKSRGVKRVRLSRARRGTVIVETLIALPVMLVLICGLIQMTLLNIAAIMTDVAAIQAGRAVYVWQGETQVPRSRSTGYTIPNQAGVEEKARIVSAGVLASIAPGTNSSGCGSSSQFVEYFRGATSTSSLTGLIAGGAGANIGYLGERAGRNNRALSSAFDDISFDMRGARKLATAYCHSSVSYEITGGNIRTTLTYDHKLTVPITGFAFSTKFGGLGERFTTIERTYVLPHQTIEPNPFTPVSLLSDIVNANPFG
jgi:hypothetical protein